MLTRIKSKVMNTKKIDEVSSTITRKAALLATSCFFYAVNLCPILKKKKKRISCDVVELYDFCTKISTGITKNAALSYLVCAPLQRLSSNVIALYCLTNKYIEKFSIDSFPISSTEHKN